MSDLISRSELIETLMKCEQLGRKSFEVVVNVINEQPTAYDIDKVVEELQENASRYTKKYTTPYGNNGYRDIKAISVKKAIEIVKQGCVRKDVDE